MNIDNICAKCIEAIKDAGYNDSTILNCKGVIRRFKTFCTERSVTEYFSEFGKLYADDVISKKTGKFNRQCYSLQRKFYRFVDLYYQTGSFNFSMKKHGKIIPDRVTHQLTYSDYQKYLRDIYDNENTIHYYESNY